MTETGWLQAKLNNAKKYNTGKPCKYGHISDRFASTGACCDCVKLRKPSKPQKAANDNSPKIGVYFQWSNVDASKVRRILYLSRHRARTAGIPHTLTADEFIQIWDRAGGRCEYTGLEFMDAVFSVSAIRPYAPSLDRIDSAKGYEFSNCRMVCNIVNLALRDFGSALLDDVCRARVQKLGPAPYPRPRRRA
jgi:hypothetical protein